MSWKKKNKTIIIYPLNGLKWISSLGRSVNTANKAINMASPVNRPKIIVGIKLDITRIENPNIIVMLVKKIALPILLWALYSDDL